MRVSVWHPVTPWENSVYKPSAAAGKSCNDGDDTRATSAGPLAALITHNTMGGDDEKGGRGEAAKDEDEEDIRDLLIFLHPS